MFNPEGYISHQLNASKTKQAHAFPKEQRFPKHNKLNSQVFYNLPSTLCKKFASFGYGNKINLTINRSSPPPGTYNLISDFQKKELKNTTTIGEGRDKVAFRSFIIQSIKRNKDIPSPDKYDIKGRYSKKGGYMGERINTDYGLKQKKSIPGPGAYKLLTTQMNNTGSYILSNYKNNISPRYFTDTSQKYLKKDQKRAHTSVFYDIDTKNIGHYANSKYKNAIIRSFGKSQRHGLEDKSKKFVPGFKYRRFSQFGDNIN